MRRISAKTCEIRDLVRIATSPVIKNYFCLSRRSLPVSGRSTARRKSLLLAVYSISLLGLSGAYEKPRDKLSSASPKKPRIVYNTRSFQSLRVQKIMTSRTMDLKGSEIQTSGLSLAWPVTL